MKKFLLSAVLLLSILSFTSCEDDCTQPARVVQVTQGISAQGRSMMNTSLVEDTTFDGDTTFNGGLNLNGFTATVTGSVQVNGHLNGPGELIYCEVLNVTGHIQNSPTLTDDCATLSDGGVGLSFGDIVEVPCDYDFANQKVKTDPETFIQYYFEPVN